MDLSMNLTATAVAKERCFKQVYVWLDPNDRFHVDIVIEREHKAGEFICPGLRCDLRVAFGTSTTELESSDIIFPFYKTAWNWATLMQHRKSHQKWVFWTSESPRHTDMRVIPPPQYADVYDYAMTYRTGVKDPGVNLLGSYGEYNDSAPTVGNNARNWAKSKSKMVAWVSTNCYPKTLSWKRTELVHALSRHVRVDIYGNCGKKKCDNITSCGLQKYKFYLALENSECRDYISEKFWKNSLGMGLVPIVFGAPKQDYLKVAPPNSFIFLQDFKTLSDLAKYLQILDRNDALYNQYFEWRKQGFVTYHDQFSNFRHEYLCSNVVKPVLEDEEKEVATGHSRTKPVLPNLTEWWSNSCREDRQEFPIIVS